MADHIQRGSSAAERRAHNPEVARANRAPAPKLDPRLITPMLRAAMGVVIVDRPNVGHPSAQHMVDTIAVQHQKIYDHAAAMDEREARLMAFVGKIARMTISDDGDASIEAVNALIPEARALEDELKAYACKAGHA